MTRLQATPQIFQTLCVCCILLSARPASALDLVVYNNNDAGAGSLRQAINDNNALSGGNTITFSNVVTGSIILASGQLDITRDVVIIGPGARVLNISGNSAFRVFSITNATVTISDLDIRNGYPATGGPGIGSGIKNYGTLDLHRCTFYFNSTPAGGEGGALYNAGTARIRDCTFLDNGSYYKGGGVRNDGFLAATNCTFFENYSLYGGGIHNSGVMALDSCTIVGNSSSSAEGGGVFQDGSVATVRNCIIATNLNYPDVYGPFTSQGYNFIGATDGSTGFNAVGDQTGMTNLRINPLLGPVQFNGGPTPTMLPLPNSPVVDHGKRSLPVDQRARRRPIDNADIINATLGDGSDIGAVELHFPAVHEWTFRKGNLSPTLGNGIMSYADTATPGLTTFGVTDGSTVPHIGGHPARYIHFPGFTALTNGYLLTLPETEPNGGGAFINEYTLIMDILVPNTLGWLAIFNTSTGNQNAAGFYIKPDGSVGIETYSDPGLITANTWYRLTFTSQKLLNVIGFYVNGNLVYSRIGDYTDGRWSVASPNPGPDLLLFNEGDPGGVYTHEAYVAHIAFIDRLLTDPEIVALGAPAWDGIFARELTAKQSNNVVVLNWRGLPSVSLQKTTSLTNANIGSWQTIGGTLGGTNYTEPITAPTYYRLIGP